MFHIRYFSICSQAWHESELAKFNAARESGSKTEKVQKDTNVRQQQQTKLDDFYCSSKSKINVKIKTQDDLDNRILVRLTDSPMYFRFLLFVFILFSVVHNQGYAAHFLCF
jgi:hypothetical protein